jgi:copper chaperone
MTRGNDMTQTWTVTGMTCAHCVASVTGVRSVDVVLESGTLTVTADAPLADDDVRRAVEEAGYALA